MRIPSAALVAVALLVTACDDEPSGPGGPAVDCSDEPTEVDVQVTTSGDDVVFDWSPRCRVAYFGVEAEDGDRWWLGDDETGNRIAPPVRYGVEPAGFDDEPALPLEDGVEYTVVLWIVGDDGEYLAAVEPFVR